MIDYLYIYMLSNWHWLIILPSNYLHVVCELTFVCPYCDTVLSHQHFVYGANEEWTHLAKLGICICKYYFLHHPLEHLINCESILWQLIVVITQSEVNFISLSYLQLVVESHFVGHSIHQQFFKLGHSFTWYHNVRLILWTKMDLVT